ncbi:GAF domain-containing SpoIIE family protein phosphatase [Actinomadura sp. NPDC047616]|uniref:PP2C family protein-serine/threonine phosphatase n=1 Tax=Actinomadura sp. NPDC047616 TaxID=3155914 RepID=UPI0033EB2914
MTEDPFTAVEQAIWKARPHGVPAAAAKILTTHFGADHAVTLLVDYRMAHLVPVGGDTGPDTGPDIGPDAGGDAEPVPLDATFEGRAFATQQTIVEPVDDGAACRLHLPLTVHGERIGVLSVHLPGPSRPEDHPALEAVATMVARALKVADGHTDVYRRARRRVRMTLAAEIQWDLLPGRSCESDEFSLAGQLEPAYAVWGDNFDWSLDAEHLTVTVTNGTGRGIEAALLTQLTVSALRNARRSGAGLVDQAVLADEILHAHHRGARTAATLLLRFELGTGRVTAVDAGSPLVYRLRGTTVEPVTLDAQLPLGMFGDTRYVEQEFWLQPGDRLVLVSDGVHQAQSPGGEVYGASALPRALRQTRLQGPPEAVRTLIRELLHYHENTELADDAVVVCLDWTGKSGQTAARPAGH